MAHRVALSDEVADALASKRAVVALESTIITHGMPYPQNLATALQVRIRIEYVQLCFGAGGVGDVKMKKIFLHMVL